MWNCVSGAVLALWAWRCCSADWQVRRRVTGKAACSAANGSARGVREDRHTVTKTTTFEWVCSWNAARQQLYNRLKGGVRLWRGSDKGSSGERDFFFRWPLFIYIPQSRWPVEVLPNRNTQKCHLRSTESLCWRTMLKDFQGNVTNLFSFASVCDARLSPHRVTHVIGRLRAVYKRAVRKQQFSEELWFTGYLMPRVTQQKWFRDCLAHPAARAKSNLAHGLHSNSQLQLFCGLQLLALEGSGQQCGFVNLLTFCSSWRRREGERGSCETL